MSFEEYLISNIKSFSVDVIKCKDDLVIIKNYKTMAVLKCSIYEYSFDLDLYIPITNDQFKLAIDLHQDFEKMNLQELFNMLKEIINGKTEQSKQ